jgi:cytoskeleton protein RodZ
MASVGPYLRELREQKGISLDEVARATRIAPRYLEALEADEHAALPERVFTKGFIRAYCQVLGEAPDEAFARFEGQDAVSAAVPIAPRAPVDAPKGRVRGTIIVSSVLLLVLGGALLALTWALQSRREIPNRSGVAATEPRPPDAASSSGSPVTGSSPKSSVAPPTPGGTAKAPATPGARSQEAAPRGSEPQTTPLTGPAPGVTAPGTSSASGSAVPIPLGQVRGMAPPYRLVARAREATWMSVKTKDGRSTEETIPAGETREWASNAPFVITIGNAGGVNLELNGHLLPSLGARGTAVFRVQLPPEGP